jgi:hypothetical protein
VTDRSTNDVNYDPYDVGLAADPYPIFKRVRGRCITTMQKEAVS